jgi:hypothetical protein
MEIPCDRGSGIQVECLPDLQAVCRRRTHPD